jgi:TrmH family RNA methyltransferase
MKLVRSKDNPEYRQLAALARAARERRRSGLTLLEGVHLCHEYRRQIGVPRAAWVATGHECVTEIAALLAAVPTVRAAAPPLLAALSSLETAAPLIYVVETPRPPVPGRLAGDAVWLDGVQDPGNVGSILRSCAAAGVATVLLGPGSAAAWSPKVLRAAQGAHFHLALHEDAGAEQWLPRLVAPLYATGGDAAAQSIHEVDLRDPAVWVFGNEGAGVSEPLAAAARRRLRIPHAGTIESINVAAAAAVCLFERLRQRTAR